MLLALGWRLSPAQVATQAAATSSQPSTPTDLLPGSGFPGATDAGPPVGDSRALGYTEPPIAGWDTAQFQTYSADFTVGLDATHIEGIDHVTFMLEGGAPKTVAAPAPNPDTGAPQRVYCVTIKPSQLKDATGVRLRAIVYPASGQPAVYQWVFNANANGTYSRTARYVDADRGSDSAGDGSTARPFQTVYRAIMHAQGQYGTADNAQIYVKGSAIHIKGGYPNPTTSWGYIRIDPWPGQEPCTVSAFDGPLDTKMVRLGALKVRAGKAAGTGIFPNSTSYGGVLYCEGTDVAGNGYDDDGSVWTYGWAVSYYKNVVIHDACQGFPGPNLAINCSTFNLGEHAIKVPYCVINFNCGSITQFKGAAGPTHPDVFIDMPDGGIIDGLIATRNVGGQGMSSRGATNSAILNSTIITNGALPNNMAYEFVWRNHVVRNCTFGGGKSIMRVNLNGKNFKASKVLFDNVTTVKKNRFGKFVLDCDDGRGGDPPPAGVVYRNQPS